MAEPTIKYEDTHIVPCLDTWAVSQVDDKESHESTLGGPGTSPTHRPFSSLRKLVAARYVTIIAGRKTRTMSTNT